MPSQKYSWSFCGLMSANGRTAMDFPSAPRSAASLRRASESASEKSAAVAKRSAGTLARAFTTAHSRASGTVPRTLRTLRTGSVNCRAMMACGVGPVNGASPTSIS